LTFHCASAFQKLNSNPEVVIQAMSEEPYFDRVDDMHVIDL